MDSQERVKLYVLGISYSPIKSGAFAMLLAEENGPYRIPIVIGASEAQSIAIKIENIITPRPMTHDLFCTFAHAYGIELKEVYIYKFEEGIFSSELRFTDGYRELSMDSRTSDAVAIAIRTGSPIYTTREILMQAGTIFDEEPKPQSSNDDADDSHSSKSIDDMPIEELKQLLDKYIEDENYEEAAKIKSIIKRREEANE